MKDWKEGHALECSSPLFQESLKISPFPPSEDVDGSCTDYDESVFFGDRTSCLSTATLQILRTLAKFQLKPESFSKLSALYGAVQGSFNDVLNSAPQSGQGQDQLRELLETLKQDEIFKVVIFDLNFLHKIWSAWRAFAYQVKDVAQDFVKSAASTPFRKAASPKSATSNRTLTSV